MDAPLKAKRRTHRTTTLSVPADDNFSEPMLAAYSDDDDDKDDDTASIKINESKTEQTSFFTNT